MRQRDGIKSKSRTRKWRFLVLILSVLVLIGLAVVAITSVQSANALMKKDVKPLAPYATNLFKDFEPLRFYSESDQITLRGWLIRAETPLRGTVIVAHHQDSNRLPYALDSARLYRELSQSGFQTVAFDFRHAGESTGDTSSFGYEESKDLRVVMEWASKITGDAPLVLYGYGTGTIAVMRAMSTLREEMLPGIPETRVLPDETREPVTDESSAGNHPPEGKESDDARRRETARRLYEKIGALILDTPARGSSAFIRAAVQSDMASHRHLFWLPETVPTVAHFSLNAYREDDFYTSFTRSTLPMMVVSYEEDSRLKYGESRVMIDERMRLHPERTLFYEAPGKGFLTAYVQHPRAYENALMTFLDTWFAR